MEMNYDPEDECQLADYEMLAVTGGLSDEHRLQFAIHLLKAAAVQTGSLDAVPDDLAMLTTTAAEKPAAPVAAALKAHGERIWLN